MKKIKYYFSLLFLLLGVFGIHAQDNLGNHAATQDLNMTDHNVSRVKYLNFQEGLGIRFFNSGSYGMDMGNSSKYHYGPVTQNSIKMKMNAANGRGWTWGSFKQVPVAALDINGTMQLKKNLYVMGKVGIGLSNPSYTLDVCGTIRAKEVRVQTGWCDYVFEENYNLPSLEEVESFINTHKHLPEVPAGADIEENGLKLAEMQATHMLKIEELTLYIIEMNKRIKTLESKLDEASKQ